MCSELPSIRGLWDDIKSVCSVRCTIDNQVVWESKMCPVYRGFLIYGQLS